MLIFNFIYQKIKGLSALSYILTGSLFFSFFSGLISKPSAVTDVYVQLLASKGVIQDFDFSGVGGHPLGFSIVASFFRLLNLDPLICIYYIQPIICGLCFYILFNLLNKILDYKYSFFISLNSLSSLVFIRSMNELTTEMISLLTVLIFISYVWDNKNNINNYKSIITIILLSWIVILFRNAAIFFIIGVIIFLFFENKLLKFKIIILGLIMLLPGIVKSLFYNNPNYTNKFLSENIFSLTLFFDVVKQLVKHFLNFTEIILPYSIHLNRIPELKFLLVFIIILFVSILFIQNNKIEGSKRLKSMQKYFIIIGFSYYIILSFLGVHYNYDWGNLYRVSAFGIVFLICAFWINMNLYCKWKKSLFIILLVSTIFKLSYGIRYEYYSREHRFLYQDYRLSTEKINNFIDDKYKNIYVYTNKSGYGRELYYMLMYYDYIHSLSFDIHLFSKMKNRTDGIILCSELDLDQFNSSKYEISNIPDLDQVYIVEY